MGALYLVRHGQASFGAADYDQLSVLGERQSRALGQWFRARGIAFDAALTGTLRRHAQTLAAIEDGMQKQHAALALPGLDEYDSDALVRTIRPEPVDAASGTPSMEAFFRLLRPALKLWMAAESQPAGMPTHAAFMAGVLQALDHVRKEHADGSVLLVSSGGPISAAIGHVLALGADATIDINLQLRNSALTEFKVSPRRHTLVSFNTLPHLDGDAASVTHA